MKKIFIILAFMILPQTAIAGEWVLWQCEFISSAKTNPPIPLTEHKTLKACQVASAQVADATFAWAKKNETLQTESVMRSINPNGVSYKSKTGFFINAEFRCYPYGIVPTPGYFQSRAIQ